MAAIFNELSIDNFFLSKQKKKNAATYVSPLSQFWENDDYVIRYVIKGNGKKTLLIVPDPPHVIEHYLEVTTELAKYYRVVLFEFPGFGFSYPKNDSYSFSVNDGTNITKGLLDELKTASCALCYSCVSGYVAWECVSRYPNRIEALVLMQTPSWEQEELWSRRIDIFGMIRTPYIGQILVWSMKYTFLKRWYQRITLSADDFHSYHQQSYKAMKNGSGFCLASAFQKTFNSKQSYTAVIQPTLLIWGIKDPTHDKTNLSDLEIYFPNGKLLYYQNASHFPMLEEPERFVYDLLEFYKP